MSTNWKELNKVKGRKGLIVAVVILSMLLLVSIYLDVEWRLAVDNQTKELKDLCSLNALAIDNENSCVDLINRWVPESNLTHITQLNCSVYGS